MDELSLQIGQNIRKYRRLKGLTLEKLAEELGTETNYLGQCERGERRFSLEKLVDLIAYFGITANDMIPVPSHAAPSDAEKSNYIQQIQALLDNCTEMQLAVVLNVLKEMVPFIKE